MSKRCAECGASRRMIGRFGDLCAFCAGEQAHPADVAVQAVTQRNVPRYFHMPAIYDEGPGDLTDGQAGVRETWARRAAQRKGWSGK